MTTRPLDVLLVASVLFIGGCGPAQEKPVSPDAPVARWLLPPELREISGLALTPDDRLFVHGDEWAVIWEIDYRRGAVLKHFGIGAGRLKGDFESIAVVDERFFLLTSKGSLLEFKEGADSSRVEYSEVDTGLRDVCEFEGMAYDPSTTSLLFACKDVLTASLKDSLVIFRWKLDGELARGLALPRITVPESDAVGTNGWKKIKPSDITVDRLTGNYVLIAAKDRAMVVLSPEGKVLSSRPLPGEHDQAEGVAITKDGLLLVSDEGPRGQADLTSYRWP